MAPEPLVRRELARCNVADVGLAVGLAVATGKVERLTAVDDGPPALRVVGEAADAGLDPSGRRAGAAVRGGAHRRMSDEAKVAIDKTALAGFIRHALDSHAESAQLRTLLDLGAAVVILPVTDEEGEERIELHLVHEKRPGHASRRRHPRRGPPSRRRRSERQLTE